jgi:hypothetical protein
MVGLNRDKKNGHVCPFTATYIHRGSFTRHLGVVITAAGLPHGLSFTVH